MSTELSFYQQRMSLLGVTDTNNRISIYDPEAEFPQPDTATWPLFAEEKTTGDIMISYYTVDGEAIRYTVEGDGKMSHVNAKTRYYETRRLKEPKGDMKYQMPAGQPTRPWFAPQLVEKFKAGTHIHTLVLTEGVFKAWQGAQIGVDVVGLPSVTCYKDRDGLYRDVQRLIEQCNVINLMILWDGDCLNISKQDLAKGEELTNRPNTFFSSAKRIAELALKIKYEKTREKVNVYFAHVKSDAVQGSPKGLDDLIQAVQTEYPDRLPRLVEELQQPDAAKPFFFFIENITSSTARLRKYFRFEKVEAFFDFHAHIIGTREFSFFGSKYRYSETEDKLQMIAPEWANRVKWVGDEFFLEDVVPGAVRSRRKLIPYNQGQFTKMFGKDFWGYLTHYKAFCNIPNHFKYQQIIETEDGSKYYNRYFPFPWAPEQGNCDTCIGIVKHIFGTHEVPHASRPDVRIPAYELGLDYIQLLLTQPTQVLPVLCLYSAENNTGKSTFGKMLMLMFGDNAVPIGNQDLHSDFNEMYVDKLIAVCDETLLERKKDAERIKAMSTAEQIMVNPKGQKQYTIDYFCKFLFTSNNLRMVYVTKHDQRFWIIKVPVLTSDNPNIMSDLKAEMPAFVHFLKNRKMATERDSRMWFHPSLIRTSIFRDVVRVNEPSEATNLRDRLTEWFSQDLELKELRMTLKEIRDEFFSERTSISWIQEILNDHLGIDLLRDGEGKAVFERGYYLKYVLRTMPDGSEDLVPEKRPYRGRPYCFRREDFINDSEIRYADTAAPVGQSALSHPAVIQTAMELDGNSPENLPEDLPF